MRVAEDPLVEEEGVFVQNKNRYVPKCHWKLCLPRTAAYDRIPTAWYRRKHRAQVLLVIPAWP
jgi:hypothetical protein